MAYKDLVSATCETEIEWTESKISARIKGVNVKECMEEGTTELRSKIDSLTAILKSSTFGISRLQGRESGPRENNTETWAREE